MSTHSMNWNKWKYHETGIVLEDFLNSLQWLELVFSSISSFSGGNMILLSSCLLVVCNKIAHIKSIVCLLLYLRIHSFVIRLYRNKNIWIRTTLTAWLLCTRIHNPSTTIEMAAAVTATRDKQEQNNYYDPKPNHVP